MADADVGTTGRSDPIGRIDLSREDLPGLLVGQFALNVSWTLVFFGGQSIAGGLAVIVALLVAIVATVVAFYRVRPVAAALLCPYLAWVAFATYLNWAFWTMN